MVHREADRGTRSAARNERGWAALVVAGVLSLSCLIEAPSEAPSGQPPGGELPPEGGELGEGCEPNGRFEDPPTVFLRIDQFELDDQMVDVTLTGEFPNDVRLLAPREATLRAVAEGRGGHPRDAEHRSCMELAEVLVETTILPVGEGDPIPPRGQVDPLLSGSRNLSNHFRVSERFSILFTPPHMLELEEFDGVRLVSVRGRAVRMEGQTSETPRVVFESGFVELDIRRSLGGRLDRLRQAGTFADEDLDPLAQDLDRAVANLEAGRPTAAAEALGEFLRDLESLNVVGGGVPAMFAEGDRLREYIRQHGKVPESATTAGMEP